MPKLHAVKLQQLQPWQCSDSKHSKSISKQHLRKLKIGDAKTPPEPERKRSKSKRKQQHGHFKEVQV